MSAQNNLRNKGTFLTFGEDELLSERVRSYTFLYNKTFEEHKEKDVVENPWKKFAEELDFIDDVKHSGFPCV